MRSIASKGNKMENQLPVQAISANAAQVEALAEEISTPRDLLEGVP
jgi:hypothetical protein